MAKFCSNCGAPTEEGAAFCRSCGARLENASPAPQPTARQAVPQQPYTQAQQPYTQAQQPYAQAQQPYAQPQQPYAQPQQPYAPVPPAPQKKRHGCLIAVLIVVLLGVLVLVLGFWLRVRSPNIPPLDPPTFVTEQGDSETSPAAAQPDYEKYGIRTDLRVGAPAVFRMGCEEDRTRTTTGTVTLTSFTREPVTEEMRAFGEENGWDLTGYERLQLRYSLSYGDENARLYGLNVSCQINDYYSIAAFDESTERGTDSYGEKYSRHTVRTADGTACVYSWYDEEREETDGAWQVSVLHTLLVPAGYDGIVSGFRDTSYDAPAHIFDDYADHPDAYVQIRLK